MLTIAVSSRALFHMEDSAAIFEEQGQEAFNEYMRKKEKIPLQPGAAFPLIKKLLNLNKLASKPIVEVCLLSRNSPEAAFRISRSIEHYGLEIEQAVFVRGDDRFKYAAALGALLFLSASPTDVLKAIEKGVASATIFPCERTNLDSLEDVEIRIALDGDAVIFSDEADQHYRQFGLDAFYQYEQENANNPLGAGPFKEVLRAINQIQALFDENNCPLKVGLITARPIQSNARVINTLRLWGVTVDALMCTSGQPKGPWLQAFGADIFFDDTQKHIDSAVGHDISTGHVPYGTGLGIFETTPVSNP